MLLLGDIEKNDQYSVKQVEVQAEPETCLASVDMPFVQLTNVVVGILVNVDQDDCCIWKHGQQSIKLAEAQSEPEKELVCVEL